MKLTKAKSAFFSNETYSVVMRQTDEPVSYDRHSNSRKKYFDRNSQHFISNVTDVCSHKPNRYPGPAWKSCKNLDTQSYVKQFDLKVLDVTDNIMATIDPTFKRRYSLKDLHTAKKEKTIERTLNSTKTLGKKYESEYLLNDNKIKSSEFTVLTPVQGQKRANTLRVKKKKRSNSICLQQ